MDYLIYTHVFLWSFLDTGKLNKNVFEILENPENTVYISSISFWEIAIKNQLKKLNLHGINVIQLPHIAEEYDFSILSPTPYDFVDIYMLPL